MGCNTNAKGNGKGANKKSKGKGSDGSGQKAAAAVLQRSPRGGETLAQLTKRIKSNEQELAKMKVQMAKLLEGSTAAKPGMYWT